MKTSTGKEIPTRAITLMQYFTELKKDGLLKTTNLENLLQITNDLNQYGGDIIKLLKK